MSYIPYTRKSPLAPHPDGYPVPHGQGKYFGMKHHGRLAYNPYDERFKVGQKVQIGKSNYVVGERRNLIRVRG